MVDARQLATDLAPGCAVWTAAFDAAGRDTGSRHVTQSWTCRTFAGLSYGQLSAVPNSATGAGRREVNKNKQLLRQAKPGGGGAARLAAVLAGESPAGAVPSVAP